MRPKRSELEMLYGTIVNNTWRSQNKYLGLYRVPEQLRNSFKYAGKPVSSISMNKDMIPAFSHVMLTIMNDNLEHLIYSYDGCFNIRLSRGSTRISTHAYAMAIDLNAEHNGLGVKPKMDLRIVEAFEAAGFVWGGRWKRPDGMHFQFVEEA